MDEVLQELKPLHEQWGGVKLLGSIAYGLRLYKNLSSLLMHIDKTETHIISSIFHVDHKYDNDDDPWPIELEDHSGHVQSVDLKPGQMLMYESAKCLHGRPKVFKGEYYSSVFIHYRPVEWNMKHEHLTFVPPPHWHEPLESVAHLHQLAMELPRIRSQGTGFMNLNDNNWSSVMGRVVRLRFENDAQTM